MSAPNDRERNERVLRKLSELLTQIPESAEGADMAEEFQAFGVDTELLSQRIRALIETAAERDRLRWLEDYRARQNRGELAVPKQGRTRGELLRAIEELQTRYFERGVSMAVGFKKLNLDALSDEDLARILAVLQEDQEEV